MSFLLCGTSHSSILNALIFRKRFLGLKIARHNSDKQSSFWLYYRKRNRCFSESEAEWFSLVLSFSVSKMHHARIDNLSLWFEKKRIKSMECFLTKIFQFRASCFKIWIRNDIKFLFYERSDLCFMIYVPKLSLTQWVSGSNREYFLCGCLLLSISTEVAMLLVYISWLEAIVVSREMHGRTRESCTEACMT